MLVSAILDLTLEGPEEDFPTEFLFRLGLVLVSRQLSSLITYSVRIHRLFDELFLRHVLFSSNSIAITEEHYFPLFANVQVLYH